MNILWAGGEDIDFLTLGSATVSTSASTFRSGWARCSISATSVQGIAKTNPFTAGAQTSAWLSFRMYPSSTGSASSLFAGFGLSGTVLGFYVASDSTTSTKIAITKYDGTTKTQLGAESGASLAVNTLMKFDMQITNFGATAAINLYLNGALLISLPSVNTTLAGMTTNFDSVFLQPSIIGQVNYSEIIVADSDTRALLGLNTLALTGAGTTTGWSNNTYTNINGITESDNSPAYVNTSGTDQEYTVGTAQPSVFSVVAVIESARLAAPSGSTPTHVKMGYGSAGVGYFGTGAQKTPLVGFSNFQQIDQTNPITSAAWAQTDITAPLQLDLQSAA